MSASVHTVLERAEVVNAIAARVDHFYAERVRALVADGTGAVSRRFESTTTELDADSADQRHGSVNDCVNVDCDN
jgi:hypothetical protein